MTYAWNPDAETYRATCPGCHEEEELQVEREDEAVAVLWCRTCDAVSHLLRGGAVVLATRGDAGRDQRIPARWNDVAKSPRLVAGLEASEYQERALDMRRDGTAAEEIAEAIGGHYNLVRLAINHAIRTKRATDVRDVPEETTVLDGRRTHALRMEGKTLTSIAEEIGGTYGRAKHALAVYLAEYPDAPAVPEFTNGGRLRVSDRDERDAELLAFVEKAIDEGEHTWQTIAGHLRRDDDAVKRDYERLTGIPARDALPPTMASRRMRRRTHVEGATHWTDEEYEAHIADRHEGTSHVAA